MSEVKGLSEVKRWDMSNDPDVFIEVNPFGDLVKYADYAALAARLKELEGDYNIAVLQLKAAGEEGFYGRVAARLSNENARLKAALEQCPDCLGQRVKGSQYHCES